MALVQDDLKRMLAYSSVSQIGYVVEGLGLGTYLGIYGSLFHLLNHTLVKALLFLAVGAIVYMTGTRKLSELGGLGRKAPITAFCFFVGALAIGGLPPFSVFMSKFTLFLAAAERGLMWAAVIAVFTGLLTVACFVRAAYKVFWGQPATNPGIRMEEVKEVPSSMWGGMLVIALVVLAFGLYPKILYPILDKATVCILEILGGVMH
jgi:formate hydrogenlyase subunit 3/multisubunit Na+/H+ antiporter MnhD subunit